MVRRATLIVTDRHLVVVAVVVWVAVAVMSLVTGPPLGHDEAAFAIRAMGGGETWLYRSEGMVVVAKLGVALGGAEWQLRLGTAVLGVGVLAGVWAVARRAFDSGTAAWATAVVAGAHWMVLRNVELIGDLPAAGCMLAGIAVLVGEFARDGGARWSILAAAPAFSAAFYLRYGSLPVVAIAAVAAAALWWRTILARPLPVLATAALFSALLVPHVVQSLQATGSLLGILDSSSMSPRREYLGEGLVTYVTSNPFRFYGALVAPTMLAGVIGLVRPPPRWRAPAFLGIVALGQILALGIASHAQPRYVFVATCLLIVLGVDAIRRFAPPRRVARRMALGLVSAAWVSMLLAIVPFNAHLASEREPIAAAAAAIRADRGEQPCTFAAQTVTQLMWYTGCEGMWPDSAVWQADQRGYVVSMPHANLPIDSVAGQIPTVELPTLDDRVYVWRIEPAKPR